MSNEVVYKVVLSNDTDGGQVAKKAGGAGGVKNQRQTEQTSGGQTSGNASAKKALGGVFAYHQIKSVATNVVSNRVSTVQLRTGSSDAQQKANFWYSTAQKGLSIVEGVATGAMFAGGIGAAIGLAVGVVNTLIDFQQDYNRWDTERQIENTQRDMRSQRETVSGSRYQGAGQI